MHVYYNFVYDESGRFEVVRWALDSGFVSLKFMQVGKPFLRKQKQKYDYKIRYKLTSYLDLEITSCKCCIINITTFYQNSNVTINITKSRKTYL